MPSALAAMRRETPGVHIEVAGPVAADMVTALRPGRDLWRYDGARAYPTMGPPSTRAATLLNEVTTPAWAHPVTAYDQALPLGQLTVGELLSLLARPPTPPAQFRSLSNGRWERSAQVFAALGILHCDEPGSVTGGPGAAHRALLVEIAYGIEDWTTEAALFALAVSAWLDPSCRDEVGDAVGQRFLHALAASRYRVVTILHSVAMLVQIVPGIDRRLAVLAREVLDGEDQETRTSLAHGAAGILRTLRLWRNR